MPNVPNVVIVEPTLTRLNNLAGGFPSKNDFRLGDYLNNLLTVVGFRTVEDIAERDALVDPPSGSWVRVLATPYVYERTVDGWTKVLTIGEVRFATLMTIDLYPVVHVYCDNVNGSDDTGDGSQGNPWAQPQRAVDAFPDDCWGRVQVNLVGVGPYVLPRFRYRTSQELSFLIVGDTASPPVHAWTLGTGVHPANGGGGLKQGVWDHDVGAPYDDSILSDGSHWLHIEAPWWLPGQSSAIGFPIDGAKSTSPNIRVVHYYDITTVPDFANVNLRPVITKMVGRDPYLPDSAAIYNDNTVDNFSPPPIFYGIRFEDISTTLAIHHVSLQACTMDNTVASYFSPENIENSNVYMNGSVCTYFGGRNTWCRGLWDGTSYFAIIGTDYECFLTGVARGRDGDSVMGYVGGVTAGRARTPTCLEIEFFDFENDAVGGSTGIAIDGADVRLGNHGPVSVENISRLFRVRYGGTALVVRINGSTKGAGDSCIFLEGSSGYGWGIVGPSGNNLSNALAPGNDFTVGATANIAVGSLPKTDLAAGDASQLVRVG